MITFVSLILGLTVGIHPIALTVSGPVARVELLLDGSSVAKLTAAPWVAQVNFGSALAPHELVAIGLDANGVEKARARQLLNLPRPPAETQIVIVHDAEGKASAARLFWATLTDLRPTRVDVRFDGLPLTVTDERAPLPPYDAATAHVLTADIQFPGGLRSRSDVVIGGGSATESATDLTAVAVEWRGAGEATRETFENAFLSNGEPVRVAAEEEGPADLLIVRDTGTEEISHKLAGIRSAHAAGGAEVSALIGMPVSARPSADSAHDEGRLAQADRLQFIWPVSQRYGGHGAIATDLFPRSHEFDFHLGLYKLLTGVEHPRGTTPKQRLTDAVAVAGLDAMGSSRRRAVLLVLGSDVDDSSIFASHDVRHYLEMMHVPLFVWTLDSKSTKAGAARWGEVKDVSTAKGFESAFGQLRKVLSSQRIVWLDGRFLPQLISLSSTAHDVQLAP